MIALGFDPGGGKAFGCAAIAVEGTCVVATATVSSVDQAVDWAKSGFGQIVAVGIDTLMFWQTTAAGWRGADEWLRKRYPLVKNSVSASNSLYGAMSVQGALLARFVEEEWPDALLTEAHPKVLWHHHSRSLPYPRGTRGKWNEDSLRDTWVEGVMKRRSNAAKFCEDEHQFDALLSAWAALSAFRGEWTLNLADLGAVEQRRPNVSLCRQINYFWPTDPQ
jgi:hypothetical protein